MSGAVITRLNLSLGELGFLRGFEISIFELSFSTEVSELRF